MSEGTIIIVPVCMGIRALVEPPKLLLTYDKVLPQSRRKVGRRKQRIMPLRDFSSRSNVDKTVYLLTQRHGPYLEGVPKITICRMLRIIQEMIKGASKEEAVRMVAEEMSINPKEDLNKASESRLKLAKEIMEQDFKKNVIPPDHPDFVYDKEEIFNLGGGGVGDRDRLRSEWDEESLASEVVAKSKIDGGHGDSWTIDDYVEGKGPPNPPSNSLRLLVPEVLVQSPEEDPSPTPQEDLNSEAPVTVPNNAVTSQGPWEDEDWIERPIYMEEMRRNLRQEVEETVSNSNQSEIDLGLPFVKALSKLALDLEPIGDGRVETMMKEEVEEFVITKSDAYKCGHDTVTSPQETVDGANAKPMTSEPSPEESLGAPNIQVAIPVKSSVCRRSSEDTIIVSEFDDEDGDNIEHSGEEELLESERLVSICDFKDDAFTGLEPAEGDASDSENKTDQNSAAIKYKINDEQKKDDHHSGESSAQDVEEKKDDHHSGGESSVQDVEETSKNADDKLKGDEDNLFSKPMGQEGDKSVDDDEDKKPKVKVLIQPEEFPITRSTAYTCGHEPMILPSDDDKQESPIDQEVLPPTCRRDSEEDVDVPIDMIDTVVSECEDDMDHFGEELLESERLISICDFEDNDKAFIGFGFGSDEAEIDSSDPENNKTDQNENSAKYKVNEDDKDDLGESRVQEVEIEETSKNVTDKLKSDDEDSLFSKPMGQEGDKSVDDEDKESKVKESPKKCKPNLKRRVKATISSLS